MVITQKSSWVEQDTGNNSSATATRAAPDGGVAIHVTSVSASFDSSVSGAQLTLKQGSTEIARWYVYDAFGLVFPSPIRIEAGNAANLELEASGSADVVGAVNMTGYTL